MRPRPLFFKKGFLNPSNPLKIATNFLEEYMELCNATHVQKLLDLLGRVKTTNENLTLWSPDNSIKLEISIKKLGGEAYWRAEFTSYVNVSNGLSVKIPFVGVSLTVSEKGYIQGFIDNMAVMEIGSTEINVSEDEAIRKALENEKIRADLEDVKQRFGLKIDRIETRLTFCERDVRTLYPSWEVKIYLNGCVINIDRHLYVVPKYNGTGWLVCAGFRASIWADTGEVYSTGVMALKGGSPPPEHTQNIIPLQFILIGCIITAITICIICKYRKCKVFPRLTKKS